MPSPKRIGQIEFGLLSPKEIREMSVRKIIWADTYDDDGFPYPQGLMDLNLGVIDPGLRCKTCDQKASECPGHFGHIELAKPVIHVGYTRLIRKLLRVTCRSCGRVLLSPEEIEKVVGTEEDQTGDLLSGPEIISRGFISEEEYPELIREAKNRVLEILAQRAIEDRKNWPEIQDEIRKTLQRYFVKSIERRPVVLPLIIPM